MLYRLTGAAAAAVLLAACTPTDQPESACASPAPSGRQCFWLSQVSGFNDAPDDKPGSDRIYVHTGPGQTYLFETFGSCPDLNFSETIGFDQNGPGQICNGIDVDLLVPRTGGGPPQRCAVRMIRKLTPDEQAARKAR